MNSLAAIQAENALFDELYQDALRDAYGAKDALRRMEEIAGLPQRDVVEVYFRYHPEMKRWAEAHIAAATCEQAMRELQADLAEKRKLRAAQRAQRDKLRQMPLEERCAPPPITQAKLEWLIGPRPLIVGPAKSLEELTAPVPPADQKAEEPPPVPQAGEKAEEPPVPAVTPDAATVAKPAKKRPGPKPELLNAIIRQMTEDYARRPDVLEQEKTEFLVSRYQELASRYHRKPGQRLSRDTVEKARKAVLSELRSNSDNPNSDN